MNNSLSFDAFTVPLAQIHVDEDTSELKSCNVYKKSNLQNMEEGNQECTDIRNTVGEEKINNINGNRVAPWFVEPKALWMKKHQPENFEKT